MSDIWRLITDSPSDGAWNMGVDGALLDSVSRNGSAPVLRLYGWDKPTLSIGYAQKLDSGINIDFLEKAGIPLVRRPTGGRAVLHWDELTYAVAIPAHCRFFGSLPEMYETIANPIRHALEDLGASLDDAGRADGARNNPCCFATRLGHEISINGKKIVGSAQRRLKTGALQHGSIVLSMDVERYADCLVFPNPSKREAAIALLGGLNDVVPKAVSRDQIKTAVIDAFKKMLGIRFITASLADDETRLARDMAVESLISTAL